MLKDLRTLEDCSLLGETPISGVRVTKTMAPVYVLEVFADGCRVEVARTLCRATVERLLKRERDMAEAL